ncbi:hypothetical protein DXG03_009117 [Asterophora parasitica]|uniref:beta-glucosidase n=1 Tax=Asterophora parasitica TaxID=117018 RepID=A0A9P7KB38_9AGAR|nr:hypothetical protein DXG03_009117 [Asterophora parasitica]
MLSLRLGALIALACTVAAIEQPVDTTSQALPKLPANLSPEWAIAYAKALAALPKLSLDDKVTLATGVQWTKGPCVGNIKAIPSIKFPGLCLQDSPLGVRLADNVSAFTAAINVAATFNRTLFRQNGAAMGAEFRGKGANVVLGPMIKTDYPAGTFTALLRQEETGKVSEATHTSLAKGRSRSSKESNLRVFKVC